MKKDIYVYPYPLTTAGASRHAPDMGERDMVPWEHKHEGDYLYLHPYWYAFDAQAKLSLVGKGSLKFSDPYDTKFTAEELQLDLEILLHMPLDQRVAITFSALNSMMVLDTNPDEPEHMFHVGAYVRYSQWLYHVNKHGVLEAVGQVTSPMIRAGAAECLRLVGLEDCTIHFASAEAWEKTRSFTTKSDGAIPRETKEEIAQRLIAGLMRELQRSKQMPKIGDHLEGTSADGYKVEADCVPDPGLIKHDPKKGKPFVLAISIFYPDGKRLMKNNKLVD